MFAQDRTLTEPLFAQDRTLTEPLFVCLQERKTRPSAAFFFSGPAGQSDGIDTMLSAWGWDVVMVDALHGGDGVDLTRTVLLARWVSRIRGQHLDFCGFSYSRDSAAQAATLDLLEACVGAGTEFWLEQPLDAAPQSRTGAATPHPLHACLGASTLSLFRLARWQGLAGASDGTYVHFLQCPLGSDTPKPTSVFASPRAAEALEPLHALRCTCESHARTRGHTDMSRSRQAYPGAMCYRLAMACEACAPSWAGSPICRSRAAALASATTAVPVEDDNPDPDPEMPELASSSEDSDSGSDDSDGDAAPDVPAGELRFGHSLHPSVRAALEVARRAPGRHSSRRRAVAAPSIEAAAAPLPCIPEVTSTAQPPRVDGQPHPDVVHPDIAWGGERPQGAITIAMLFLPGVYDAITRWLVAAEAALQALAEGRRPTPPGTLVISQAEMQPWARRLIWDCRNAADCRLCAASTAETVFPGRQMNRASFRAMATRNNIADAEIIRQAGGGGIEAQSSTSLDTVLDFHHMGLQQNFAAAAKVIEQDIAEEFVSAAYAHLPMVPCRLGPRNVVMQDRSKLDPDSGELVAVQKPRVTFDLSRGRKRRAAPSLQPLSVNGGTRPAHTQLTLPDSRDFGAACGITQVAVAHLPSVQVEAGSVDITNAYSWLLQQQLDWWLQCFVWSSGVRISFRVVFGGAFGPHRFSGVMAVPHAETARRIEEFEVTQPPPTAEWTRERQALQASNLLPGGSVQHRSWAMQRFLDDINLVAPNDRVVVPPELVGISLGAEATATAGGAPSHPSSRIAVYVCFTISTLGELDFVVAESKTQCGPAIVSLGIRVDIPAERQNCPALKRAAVLQGMAEALAALASNQPLDCDEMERLVGRLGSLAAIFPALLTWMHAGYAVASAKYLGTALRPLRRLRLAPGGRRRLEFTKLLHAATAELTANVGAPLLCAPSFPAIGTPGTLTCATDASGDAASDDAGVGGYSFLAGQPNTIYVVSELWPLDIRAALASAARTRAERALDTQRPPMLAVPTSEAFGMMAIPAAVVQLLGRGAIQRVIAIGDCAPASKAYEAASSRSAQIRAMLRAADAVADAWLPVDVPRELNTDPDRLSHPASLTAVVADAEALGLSVVQARIPDSVWATLRAATLLSLANERGHASQSDRADEHEGACERDSALG